MACWGHKQTRLDLDRFALAFAAEAGGLAPTAVRMLCCFASEAFGRRTHRYMLLYSIATRNFRGRRHPPYTLWLEKSAPFLRPECRGGEDNFTVRSERAPRSPVCCFFFAPLRTVTLAWNRQQAFSSEAAAVERGLHLQLGDKDAKTESQLGGQQLEAAKRLRHLLVTNRWVPALTTRGLFACAG